MLSTATISAAIFTKLIVLSAHLALLDAYALETINNVYRAPSYGKTESMRKCGLDVNNRVFATSE
jgi:hypothetical protein